MTTNTSEKKDLQGTEVPASSRARFFNLEVSNVRKLTADSIEVSFDVPAELTDDFDYLPGQYVAIRATIPDADGNDVELRRSYSICAEPKPGEIKVAIKKDLGGLFSTWANEHLQVGDSLELMSPTGAFISKHKMTGLNDPESIDVADGGNFVALAAGSGITPVIAIARTVLAANENVTFNLIYANKAAMDVMFVEELADLKDRYPSRFALHHVLSREQRISPLLSGRIDSEKLTQLLDTVVQVDQIDEWFMCGPFELVQLIRDTLKEKGVAEEQVRFELFNTGTADRPEGNIGRPVEVDPEGENYSISFKLDGLEGNVDSPVNARETILNAALRVRPDVPFACAGGVCGTCRAKVVSGETQMEANFALEADEVEAGYVLTCQTRPTSDAVTVDFDA